jgi:hypothetical protein
MNQYQLSVLHSVGWFFVLLDGWAMHVHWLAVIGFGFLFYSFYKFGANDGE